MNSTHTRKNFVLLHTLLCVICATVNSHTIYPFVSGVLVCVIKNALPGLLLTAIFASVHSILCMLQFVTKFLWFHRTNQSLQRWPLCNRSHSSTERNMKDLVSKFLHLLTIWWSLKKQSLCQTPHPVILISLFPQIQFLPPDIYDCLFIYSCSTIGC